MELQGWHLWLILCFVLLIVEIFTTGFVVALIGLACIAPAALAYAGLGMAWQLAGLAAAMAVSLIVIRPICMKFLTRDHPHSHTNVDALVGREGIVTEPIPADGASGYVKIGENIGKRRRAPKKQLRAASASKSAVSQGVPLL